MVDRPPPGAGPGSLPGGPGELPLDLREVAPPWLDSEDEGVGSRGGGLIPALIGGLVALALLGAGGLWLIRHRAGPSAMVVASGVIQAPPGPYKTRPADPGGKLAAGTGDTRFLVAEGKRGAVRVAGATDAIATATAGPAGAGGVAVQLGAYPTEAEAEAAWPIVSQRFAVLAGLRHRVAAKDADLGSVFTLQALTETRPAAETLCRELKAGGMNCEVRE